MKIVRIRTLYLHTLVNRSKLDDNFTNRYEIKKCLFENCRQQKRKLLFKF